MATGFSLMGALYLVEGKVSSIPLLAAPGFLRVILGDFPLFLWPEEISLPFLSPLFLVLSSF